MARGWGRSEEDLGADRELAKESAREPSGGLSPGEARRAATRRSLELSLARIEELLAKTENPERRRALETAKAELGERLASLAGERSGP